ncbi:hypothetical protein ADK64_32860 [Streptomyces sp. MMG1121]|nr:hypothetical protein ADK64_32860 [Streptomyces sp. MMG1121]
MKSALVKPGWSRCLLVSALMSGFAWSTWWAPRSLQRFRIREEAAPAADEPAAEDAEDAEDAEAQLSGR